MGKNNLQSVSGHIKKFIFSSLLIFILCTPSARGNIDPLLAAKLQYAIDSVRTHLNYKGVSASVFIPSQGTWAGTSGLSHGAVAITPDMKFAIASNTKTFVAVLMLKLQEMNILSLDDSLYKWIPNYQYVDSTITIRQLLNHTSGVFNYTTFPGYWTAMYDTGRFWTPEEILTTYMNPPYFNPGVAFLYSNTNYILVGMIIKAATGYTVSHNLRQLILNPINLTDTYFPVEESVPDTIAHGWEFGVETKYPSTSFWSSIWAAGAMYSTAENMVRFYKDLFNLQIINQTSFNQMLTFPNQSIGIYYGLGIGMGLFGGREQFFHTGGWFGYTSITGIDTTARFIISVLINHRPSFPDNFIAPINKIILEHLPTSISNSENSLPAEYSLSQNYPNPFNPSTTIKFTIASVVDAKFASTKMTQLKVYDVLGSEVAILVNEKKPPGNYEVNMDASKLSSGVYFYELRVGNFIKTKKMILLR